MNAPELPYSDAAYVEMWTRVATEWRERNRFGQLRDFARSRSSIMSAESLQQLLGYLEGAPEMQRDAIEAFRQRQGERDAEAARRAPQHKGKAIAHALMKERREYLKTRAKGKRR